MSPVLFERRKGPTCKRTSTLSRALVTDCGNAVSGWGVRVTGHVMFGDDVIVTGGFTGNVDFGRGSVDGGSGNNAFLARYDAAAGTLEDLTIFPRPTQLLGATPAPRGRVAVTMSTSGSTSVLTLVPDGAGETRSRRAARPDHPPRLSGSIRALTRSSPSPTREPTPCR